MLLAVAGFCATAIMNGGATMADDLTAQLLSPDFAVADQALSAAIKRRDAALIAVALGQKHLEMKVKAARALLDLGDRATVPRLIAALEGNQVFYTGDSETKVLQKELDQALVAALAKLTGIDFGAAAGSPADIGRALRLSREWWEKNKN